MPCDGCGRAPAHRSQWDVRHRAEGLAGLRRSQLAGVDQARPLDEATLTGIRLANAEQATIYVRQQTLARAAKNRLAHPRRTLK